MHTVSKTLATLTFTIAGFILPNTSASAQGFREDLHVLETTGHAPIGYSQTDEDISVIYADPEIPGNILLFYTGRSQAVDKWVSTDSQIGWNREHLWAQSRDMRPLQMKSDLHNLKPTDASINQGRSNLNFDEGGSPKGEAPDTFGDQ